jgi:hypothetical protein
MKVLVDKHTKAVVYIGKTAEMVENGIDVGGMVFGMAEQLDIFDVENVPENVRSNEYLYTESEGFVKNPNFELPVPGPTDEIQQLKQQLAEANQKLADQSTQMEAMQAAIDVLMGV